MLLRECEESSEDDGGLLSHSRQLGDIRLSEERSITQGWGLTER